MMDKYWDTFFERWEFSQISNLERALRNGTISVREHDEEVDSFIQEHNCRVDGRCYGRAKREED